MKHSIARKLSLRVSLVLLAAFILLIAGSYYSISSIVRVDAERYAKSLGGIYSDLVLYEAEKANVPIDLSYSDDLAFFGEYMCSWYRVDCIFAYVPDVEKGTIQYLSVTWKDSKTDSISQDHMVGLEEKYELTSGELAVWKGENTFAIEENENFGRGLFVSMAITDTFGNRSMTGVVVSVNELFKSVMHSFIVTCIALFLVITAVAVLLYLLMRKMVSNPARRISRRMSEYVAGGRRSVIKLDANQNDEYSMIADAFNHMTEDMERYVKDISSLNREKERQRAEMDIAVNIQNNILPSGTASLKHCSVKAVMKPAKSVGGDLYDYMQLDETRTMIIIADVSGKGVPAAMLMAVVLTHFHQLARMGYSPAGILGAVNDSFSQKNAQLMFVTAFVGIYDSETGLLTYANAGHNPPYAIHNGPELLCGSEGVPLGIFSGEKYTDAEVKLQAGDSVFLYTDGVNEAVNEAGGFYGTERLESVLREEAGTEKKHFVEAVGESVRSFAAGAEQNDDITMLCMHVRNIPTLELGYEVGEFVKIQECIMSGDLPREMLMELCVAAEECFVNICSYAFDGPPPEGERVLFSFEYSDKAVIRFSDGGRPFDPRHGLPTPEEYDVDTAIGGLGRLIAFTVADSVDYEYRDGRNILTITKSLREPFQKRF